MDTLLASIRRYGVQVPITVYQDHDHYVLIDGERRWRCATKLNLKKIPALVQEKPTRLLNILLMFNIHALREQWDYFTIAKKLPDVIELFREENGRRPNEIELSEITGLTRGQIRRCGYLLELPAQYRSLLERELELPKAKQKLSEDFFIEMERALRTLEKRLPEAIEDKNAVRNILIAKYRAGVIGNVTDFRMLSKIATSLENLGVRRRRAVEAVEDIFDPSSGRGIADVYAESFEVRYDERKIGLNIESINEFLEWGLESEEITFGEDLKQSLRQLRRMIDRVLRS